MTSEQTSVTETMLEERLALLESQINRRKQRLKRTALVIIGMCVMVALFSAVVLWQRQQSASPYKHFKALNAGYTLYVPATTVDGYILDIDSIQNNHDFVTFVMKNGQRTVTITEQAAPPSPPSLSDFKGFDKLDLAIGHGVVGTNAGRTIGVIITRSAIINMTGTTGVPASTLSALATTFKPLD